MILFLRWMCYFILLKMNDNTLLLSLNDTPSFLSDVPLIHLLFLDLARAYACLHQVMPPWSCLYCFLLVLR